MRFLFLMPLLSVFIYAFTLEELIELSHKNRLMESAAHSLESKKSSYESIKNSYMPTIDAGVTYQNSYEETPSSPQNSLKLWANLKYTLYDGGKKESLYSLHKSGVDAKEENIKAVKNVISLEVSKLYFEYMALKADTEATLQEIEQLKAELKRVESFYESGSTTKDEVSKIDSRLKNASVALHEIELQSQRVLHSLEYYTMQKVDSLKGGSKIALLSLSDVQTRPDIRALEYDAEALLYDAKSKRSENLPTLYLEDAFSYNDYYFDDKSQKSSFLVDTQNIASLNLSWRVFDFDSIDKNYESKFYDYLSKKSAIEHEKHVADVEYRLAKRSAEIAKQKVDASLATLEAATSTYELVKFRYQNGTIDNVAYLESLSEKYDAQRAYERALYDLEVKKAELIYYGAQDIKEFL